MKVLPPGPFPPTGDEPDGVIDLGIRLRDTLYRRPVVLDARAALHSNIRVAARSPQQLLMVLPSIDAFIDTWPLAAMIDEAMAAWRDEPNPRSLAVMFRAAEVIGQVLGWPRSVDRRWPLPDEAWMRRHVEGQVVVVPRGPRDGSAAAAVALNSNFVLAEPMALPETRTVHGDALAGEVEALVAALQAGEIHAVEVDGWIPWDDASQAAFHRLSATTDLQDSFVRYGLAALVAGPAPTFEDMLDEAPPGTFGRRFRPVCEAIVVPTLDGDGAMQPVGVLCWDDCYRPVKVNPVAISVLEAVEDHPEIPALAAALKADVAVVENVLRQLCEVGAVTSDEPDDVTLVPADDDIQLGVSLEDDIPTVVARPPDLLRPTAEDDVDLGTPTARADDDVSLEDFDAPTELELDED